MALYPTNCESVKFGRETNFPKENVNFFLKCLIDRISQILKILNSKIINLGRRIRAFSEGIFSC
jgi:uncharacterized protein (DUF2132 family)